MSKCVRSGWCCKQGPCPYGKWNVQKGHCEFLEGDRPGNYKCGKYDEIIKDPSSIFSPAFGQGCSSALNPARAYLIRKSAR